MDPLFTIPDEVGLEAPPAQQPQAAAVLIVCPNCGCNNCSGNQDPAVAEVNAATVTCPQCQCEFEAPADQPGAPLPMESSVHRVLGRVFERHFRRQHTHALNRVAGQQKQPKLPELSSNG